MLWFARLMVALALMASPALADSFGEWSFSPPDGYEHEVTTYGMTYKGPGGVFIFAQSEPAEGRSLLSVAPRMVAEVTGAAMADIKPIQTFSPEDGLDVAIYLASLDNAVFMVSVSQRYDRFALALFIAGSTDVEAEQTALLETVFEPAAVAQVAPPIAANWPAALPDNRATARPNLSIAEAQARGLHPEYAPIPGKFLCYIVEDPRPMTPEPDLTVTFTPTFGYTVTDGKTNGKGRWSIGSNDTFDHMIELTGALEGESYILINRNEYGQSFTMEHPFTENETELRCLQDGPAVEAVVQAMAMAAIDKGLFSCVNATGETFKLIYANGNYRMPAGSGQMAQQLSSYSGREWDSVITFPTGPLALYGGKIETDPSGSATLSLSTEWHTGSLFYSSTETTIYAQCRMKLQRRPMPVYGMDPAPAAAAPQGGLPEGLFASFEGYYSYNGTMSTYVFEERLTYVAPGGRIYYDVDLDDIGDLPDCTRTRPDGFAFCGDYIINGRTIRLRDPDETDWQDPASLTITDDGFTMDEVEFAAVPPLDPAALIGTWVADSFTGGGPGIGGGVGVYTDADVWWTFDDAGRFEWAESSTTQTMISPDPILGGAMGGGSSSSQDGGTGRYAVEGVWLVLTFDDGRVKKLVVQPTQSDEYGPGLTIGDTGLKQG